MDQDDIEQVLALMEGYVPEAVRRELQALAGSPSPARRTIGGFSMQRIDTSGKFQWPWDSGKGLVIARGGGGGGGAEGGAASARRGGRGGGGGNGGYPTNVLRSGRVLCGANGGAGGRGGNGAVPNGMRATPGYPGAPGGVVIAEIEGLTKGEVLDVTIGRGGTGGICEGDNPGAAGNDGGAGFVVFAPLAAA